ncbi:hypothetical protein BLNAU_1882 [Blattamonas nauphoetae]|uniref:Cell morphogenesis protein C-terminal domain-containing protein n=1 Tax=Blattamonas nauphoetae TaxID=2049346 RepID=A0ABQ9YHV9_9EUKA|nr:hypothetical protein BLNAU_1882 [Blattamonas nauphoetae]
MFTHQSITNISEILFHRYSPVEHFSIYYVQFILSVATTHLQQALHIIISLQKQKYTAFSDRVFISLSALNALVNAYQHVSDFAPDQMMPTEAPCVIPLYPSPALPMPTANQGLTQKLPSGLNFSFEALYTNVILPTKRIFSRTNVFTAEDASLLLRRPLSGLPTEDDITFATEFKTNNLNPNESLTSENYFLSQFDLSNNPNLISQKSRYIIPQTPIGQNVFFPQIAAALITLRSARIHKQAFITEFDQPKNTPFLSVLTNSIPFTFRIQTSFLVTTPFTKTSSGIAGLSREDERLTLLENMLKTTFSEEKAGSPETHGINDRGYVWMTPDTVDEATQSLFNDYSAPLLTPKSPSSEPHIGENLLLDGTPGWIKRAFSTHPSKWSISGVTRSDNFNTLHPLQILHGFYSKHNEPLPFLTPFYLGTGKAPELSFQQLQRARQPYKNPISEKTPTAILHAMSIKAAELLGERDPLIAYHSQPSQVNRFLPIIQKSNHHIDGTRSNSYTPSNLASSTTSSRLALKTTNSPSTLPAQTKEVNLTFTNLIRWKLFENKFPFRLAYYLSSNEEQLWRNLETLKNEFRGLVLNAAMVSTFRVAAVGRDKQYGILSMSLLLRLCAHLKMNRKQTEDFVAILVQNFIHVNPSIQFAAGQSLTYIFRTSPPSRPIIITKLCEFVDTISDSYASLIALFFKKIIDLIKEWNEFVNKGEPKPTGFKTTLFALPKQTDLTKQASLELLGLNDEDEPYTPKLVYVQAFQAHTFLLQHFPLHVLESLFIMGLCSPDCTIRKHAFIALKATSTLYDTLCRQSNLIPCVTVYSAITTHMDQLMLSTQEFADTWSLPNEKLKPLELMHYLTISDLPPVGSPAMNVLLKYASISTVENKGQGRGSNTSPADILTHMMCGPRQDELWSEIVGHIASIIQDCCPDSVKQAWIRISMRLHYGITTESKSFIQTKPDTLWRLICYRHYTAFMFAVNPFQSGSTGTVISQSKKVVRLDHDEIFSHIFRLFTSTNDYQHSTGVISLLRLHPTLHVQFFQIFSDVINNSFDRIATEAPKMTREMSGIAYLIFRYCQAQPALLLSPMFSNERTIFIRFYSRLELLTISYIQHQPLQLAPQAFLQRWLNMAQIAVTHAAFTILLIMMKKQMDSSLVGVQGLSGAPSMSDWKGLEYATFDKLTLDTTVCTPPFSTQVISTPSPAMLSSAFTPPFGEKGLSLINLKEQSQPPPSVQSSPQNEPEIKKSDHITKILNLISPGDSEEKPQLLQSSPKGMIHLLTTPLQSKDKNILVLLASSYFPLMTEYKLRFHELYPTTYDNDLPTPFLHKSYAEVFQRSIAQIGQKATLVTTHAPSLPFGMKDPIQRGIGTGNHFSIPNPIFLTTQPSLVPSSVSVTRLQGLSAPYPTQEQSYLLDPYDNFIQQNHIKEHTLFHNPNNLDALAATPVSKEKPTDTIFSIFDSSAYVVPNQMGVPSVTSTSPESLFPIKNVDDWNRKMGIVSELTRTNDNLTFTYHSSLFSLQTQHALITGTYNIVEGLMRETTKLDPSFLSYRDGPASVAPTVIASSVHPPIDANGETLLSPSHRFRLFCIYLALPQAFSTIPEIRDSLHTIMGQSQLIPALESQFTDFLLTFNTVITQSCALLLDGPLFHNNVFINQNPSLSTVRSMRREMAEAKDKNDSAAILHRIAPEDSLVFVNATVSVQEKSTAELILRDTVRYYLNKESDPTKKPGRLSPLEQVFPLISSVSAPLSNIAWLASLPTRKPPPYYTFKMSPYLTMTPLMSGTSSVKHSIPPITRTPASENELDHQIITVDSSTPFSRYMGNLYTAAGLISSHFGDIPEGTLPQHQLPNGFYKGSTFVQTLSSDMNKALGHTSFTPPAVQVPMPSQFIALMTQMRLSPTNIPTSSSYPSSPPFPTHFGKILKAIHGVSQFDATVDTTLSKVSTLARHSRLLVVPSKEQKLEQQKKRLTIRSSQRISLPGSPAGGGVGIKYMRVVQEMVPYRLMSGSTIVNPNFRNLSQQKFMQGTTSNLGGNQMSSSSTGLPSSFTQPSPSTPVSSSTQAINTIHPIFNPGITPPGDVLFPGFADSTPSLLETLHPISTEEELASNLFSQIQSRLTEKVSDYNGGIVLWWINTCFTSPFESTRQSAHTALKALITANPSRASVSVEQCYIHKADSGLVEQHFKVLYELLLEDQLFQPSIVMIVLGLFMLTNANHQTRAQAARVSITLFRQFTVDTFSESDEPSEKEHLSRNVCLSVLHTLYHIPDVISDLKNVQKATMECYSILYPTVSSAFIRTILQAIRLVPSVQSSSVLIGLLIPHAQNLSLDEPYLYPILKSFFDLTLEFGSICQHEIMSLWNVVSEKSDVVEALISLIIMGLKNHGMNISETSGSSLRNDHEEPYFLPAILNTITPRLFTTKLKHKPQKILGNHPLVNSSAISTPNASAPSSNPSKRQLTIQTSYDPSADTSPALSSRTPQQFAPVSPKRGSQPTMRQLPAHYRSSTEAKFSFDNPIGANQSPNLSSASHQPPLSATTTIVRTPFESPINLPLSPSSVQLASVSSLGESIKPPSTPISTSSDKVHTEIAFATPHPADQLGSARSNFASSMGPIKLYQTTSVPADLHLTSLPSSPESFAGVQSISLPVPDSSMESFTGSPPVQTTKPSGPPSGIMAGGALGGGPGGPPGAGQSGPPGGGPPGAGPSGPPGGGQPGGGPPGGGPPGGGPPGGFKPVHDWCTLSYNPSLTTSSNSLAHLSLQAAAAAPPFSNYLYESESEKKRGAHLQQSPLTGTSSFFSDLSYDNSMPTISLILSICTKSHPTTVLNVMDEWEDHVSQFALTSATAQAKKSSNLATRSEFERLIGYVHQTENELLRFVLKADLEQFAHGLSYPFNPTYVENREELIEPPSHPVTSQLGTAPTPNEKSPVLPKPTSKLWISSFHREDKLTKEQKSDIANILECIKPSFGSSTLATLRSSPWATIAAQSLPLHVLLTLNCLILNKPMPEISSFRIFQVFPDTIEFRLTMLGVKGLSFLSWLLLRGLIPLNAITQIFHHLHKTLPHTYQHYTILHRYFELVSYVPPQDDPLFIRAERFLNVTQKGKLRVLHTLISDNLLLHAENPDMIRIPKPSDTHTIITQSSLSPTTFDAYSQLYTSFSRIFAHRCPKWWSQIMRETNKVPVARDRPANVYDPLTWDRVKLPWPPSPAMITPTMLMNPPDSKTLGLLDGSEFYVASILSNLTIHRTDRLIELCSWALVRINAEIKMIVDDERSRVGSLDDFKPSSSLVALITTLMSILRSTEELLHSPQVLTRIYSRVSAQTRRRKLFGDYLVWAGRPKGGWKRRKQLLFNETSHKGTERNRVLLNSKYIQHRKSARERSEKEAENFTSQNRDVMIDKLRVLVKKDFSSQNRTLKKEHSVRNLNRPQNRTVLPSFTPLPVHWGFSDQNSHDTPMEDDSEHSLDRKKDPRFSDTSLLGFSGRMPPRRFGLPKTNPTEFGASLPSLKVKADSSYKMFSRTNNSLVEIRVTAIVQRSTNIIRTFRSLLSTFIHTPILKNIQKHYIQQRDRLQGSTSEKIRSTKSDLKANPLGPYILRTNSEHSTSSLRLDPSILISLLSRSMSHVIPSSYFQSTFCYRTLQNAVLATSSTQSAIAIQTLMSLSSARDPAVIAIVAFELVRSVSFFEVGGYAAFTTFLSHLSHCINVSTPSFLIQFSRLFWVGVALLQSPFIPIFSAGLEFMIGYLRKCTPLFATSSVFRNSILNSQPRKGLWPYVGLIPLIMKGVFHNSSVYLTCQLLALCHVLPPSCDSIMNPLAIIDPAGAFASSLIMILPMFCATLDGFAIIARLFTNPSDVLKQSSVFPTSTELLVSQQTAKEASEPNKLDDSSILFMTSHSTTAALDALTLGRLNAQQTLSFSNIHEQMQDSQPIAEHLAPLLEPLETDILNDNLKQMLDPTTTFENDSLPFQEERVRLTKQYILLRDIAQFFTTGALIHGHPMIGVIMSRYASGQFTTSSDFLESLIPLLLCAILDTPNEIYVVHGLLRMIFSLESHEITKHIFQIFSIVLVECGSLSDVQLSNLDSTHNLHAGVGASRIDRPFDATGPSLDSPTVSETRHLPRKAKDKSPSTTLNRLMAKKRIAPLRRITPLFICHPRYSSIFTTILASFIDSPIRIETARLQALSLYYGKVQLIPPPSIEQLSLPLVNPEVFLETVPYTQDSGSLYRNTFSVIEIPSILFNSLYTELSSSLKVDLPLDFHTKTETGAQMESGTASTPKFERETQEIAHQAVLGFMAHSVIPSMAITRQEPHNKFEYISEIGTFVRGKEHLMMNMRGFNSPQMTVLTNLNELNTDSSQAQNLITTLRILQLLMLPSFASTSQLFSQTNGMMRTMSDTSFGSVVSSISSGVSRSESSSLNRSEDPSHENETYALFALLDGWVRRTPQATRNQIESEANLKISENDSLGVKSAILVSQQISHVVKNVSAATIAGVDPLFATANLFKSLGIAVGSMVRHHFGDNLSAEAKAAFESKSNPFGADPKTAYPPALTRSLTDFSVSSLFGPPKEIQNPNVLDMVSLKDKSGKDRESIQAKRKKLTGDEAFREWFCSYLLYFPGIPIRHLFKTQGTDRQETSSNQDRQKERQRQLDESMESAAKIQTFDDILNSSMLSAFPPQLEARMQKEMNETWDGHVKREWETNERLLKFDIDDVDTEFANYPDLGRVYVKGEIDQNWLHRQTQKQDDGEDQSFGESSPDDGFSENGSSNVTHSFSQQSSILPEHPMISELGVDTIMNFMDEDVHAQVLASLNARTDDKPIILAEDHDESDSTDDEWRSEESSSSVMGNEGIEEGHQVVDPTEITEQSTDRQEEDNERPETLESSPRVMPVSLTEDSTQ